LGLQVVRRGRKRGLLVEDVLTGGAIDSWNRIVACGPLSPKAVLPGDLIVRIDDCLDSDSMLSRCLDHNLMRMYIFRGPTVSANPDPRGRVQLLSDGSFSAFWPTME